MKKGLCNEPVLFRFIDKNSDGKYIGYGLCKRHAKEQGVYHVKNK